MYGEVFCQVASCDNGRVSQRSCSLAWEKLLISCKRSHLGHEQSAGASTPPWPSPGENPFGAPHSGGQGQVIAWYNALFDEEEEDGDDQL